MVLGFDNLIAAVVWQVGNTWRTTDDIQDNYNSMLANLDNTIGLAQFAGPGSWNDPDLLEVCTSAWLMAITEFSTRLLT